jgi:hypothetical protein
MTNRGTVRVILSIPATIYATHEVPEDIARQLADGRLDVLHQVVSDAAWQVNECSEPEEMAVWRVIEIGATVLAD